MEDVTVLARWFEPVWPEQACNSSFDSSVHFSPVLEQAERFISFCK